MGHAASRPVLTRRQRQDELVKMYPGSAKVIRRPNTNPDGSEIVTISDYEFPDLNCEDYIKSLCEAMRLRSRGRDDGEVQLFRNLLQRFCGIEADADAAINNTNGSAT